jgi:hypothetical protein
VAHKILVLAYTLLKGAVDYKERLSPGNAA